MVFVRSSLTKGNPAYTVVQVATNDLIVLVAFVPSVSLLLGMGNVAVPLIIQTILIFGIAYIASYFLRLPHDIVSPATLATIVVVLVEVPIMLFLVKVSNSTKGWFKKYEKA